MSTKNSSRVACLCCGNTVALVWPHPLHLPFFFCAWQLLLNQLLRPMANSISKSQRLPLVFALIRVRLFPLLETIIQACEVPTCSNQLQRGSDPGVERNKKAVERWTSCMGCECSECSESVAAEVKCGSFKCSSLSQSLGGTRHVGNVPHSSTQMC